MLAIMTCRIFLVQESQQSLLTLDGQFEYNKLVKFPPTLLIES